MIRITMDDVDNIMRDIEDQYNMIIPGMISLQAYTTLEGRVDAEEVADHLGTLVFQRINHTDMPVYFLGGIRTALLQGIEDHPDMELVLEVTPPYDPIVAALKEWVDNNPEESEVPIKAKSTDDHFWSAREILEEIVNDTDRGREEYRKLVQLTINLLTRGKIK